MMVEYPLETDLLKISRDILILAENIAVIQTKMAIICEDLDKIKEKIAQ